MIYLNLLMVFISRNLFCSEVVPISLFEKTISVHFDIHLLPWKSNEQKFCRFFDSTYFSNKIVQKLLYSGMKLLKIGLQSKRKTVYLLLFSRIELMPSWDSSAEIDKNVAKICVRYSSKSVHNYHIDFKTSSTWPELNSSKA